VDRRLEGATLGGHQRAYECTSCKLAIWETFNPGMWFSGSGFVLLEIFNLVWQDSYAIGSSLHVWGVSPNGISIFCPEKFIVCIVQSCWEEDVRGVKFCFCDGAVRAWV
jgi:hypothetical protein